MTDSARTPDPGPQPRWSPPWWWGVLAFPLAHTAAGYFEEVGRRDAQQPLIRFVPTEPISAAEPEPVSFLDLPFA